MSGFGRSEGQHLGLLDLRQRLHLGENVLRYAAVDLDQRDGIATLPVRPRLNVAMLSPASPSRLANLPMKPGLSSFVT